MLQGYQNQRHLRVILWLTKLIETAFDKDEKRVDTCLNNCNDLKEQAAKREGAERADESEIKSY